MTVPSKIKWRDTTSYSRSARRGVDDPREWTATVADVQIVVHHLFGCGDTWYFSTRRILAFSKCQLESRNVEAAQQEAVDHVYDAVIAIARAIEAAR